MFPELVYIVLAAFKHNGTKFNIIYMNSYKLDTVVPSQTYLKTSFELYTVDQLLFEVLCSLCQCGDVSFYFKTHLQKELVSILK